MIDEVLVKKRVWEGVMVGVKVEVPLDDWHAEADDVKEAWDGLGCVEDEEHELEVIVVLIVRVTLGLPERVRLRETLTVPEEVKEKKERLGLPVLLWVDDSEWVPDTLPV